MTPEQENQLRRILKLKRYEQPPPGYFNDFSRRVIDQIKAEQREPAKARPFREGSWVQRLMSAFEVEPALVGTFGVLLCALMIAGIVYSEKTDDAPLSLVPGTVEAAVTPASTPASLVLGPTGGSAMLVSSTNPIIQPAGSLFDQMPLNVQPADGRTWIIPP